MSGQVYDNAFPKAESTDTENTDTRLELCALGTLGYNLQVMNQHVLLKVLHLYMHMKNTWIKGIWFMVSLSRNNVSSNRYGLTMLDFVW